MKIIITVPQKLKDKWKVSFGGTPSYRKDATLIFRLIERRIYARQLKEKVSILVKYTKDTFNESLLSLDARYLLYALACFLESYLPEATLKKKERRYKQN